MNSTDNNTYTNIGIFFTKHAALPSKFLQMIVALLLVFIVTQDEILWTVNETIYLWCMVTDIFW